MRIIKKFVYSNYFIIFYIIYSSPLQMFFVCLSSINTKIATTTAAAAAKYNGNEIKSNAHLDWTNSILYFFKSRTKGSTQIDA